MTVPAKKFISCIYRIREASGVCFGAQHVIDVLMGNMTDRVARFSHDKLRTCRRPSGGFCFASLSHAMSSGWIRRRAMR